TDRLPDLPLRGNPMGLCASECRSRGNGGALNRGRFRLPFSRPRGEMNGFGFERPGGSPGQGFPGLASHGHAVRQQSPVGTRGVA
nr:hypothetical protein [Tanacetum cinerariifolium]